MNTPLKKLCVYGLAGGLGKIVREQVLNPEKKEKYFADLTQDETELLLWNCAQLESAGQKAMDTAKVKRDRSMIRQAERKIIEAAGTVGEIDVLRMLSFLFLGLAELELYCKDNGPIQELREAALNWMVQFDPNLELSDVHEEAHEKFKGWVA
ncbi:hypothetical protein C4588_06100 [Candidatus Parcubacteria bacterium]|nr:MAG: hypothetical protein C4588_06100 [Candidatus Parcubacteria bacterium]